MNLKEIIFDLNSFGVVGINGLETISKLLNKDVKEYYPYPDTLNEGVRPPNSYEIAEKINEIIEKVNILINVVQREIRR